MIDNPKAEDSAFGLRRGAGFPDRRRAGRQPRKHRSAYATGAAASASRLDLDEREKGGGWHLLVSEIPMAFKRPADRADAALIADKKLPILADVKDESDNQVRLILSRAPGRSIPNCCSKACTG